MCSLLMCKKHLLCCNNIHLLNDIHPDFTSFGISAMDKRLQHEVYRRRPYGGVAVLWRKCCWHKIQVQSEAQYGRCLSIDVDFDDKTSLRIINVYLPCFTVSAQYSCELAECLSFVEDALCGDHDVILLGDMNFSCDMSNAGFRECYSLFSRFNLYHCDNLITERNRVTYRSDSLNQSSFIDHVFVSNSIRHHVSTITLYDSGSNMSDHIPLIVSLNLQIDMARAYQAPHRDKSDKRYAWRWDKSNLNSYYSVTQQLLSNLEQLYHFNDCNAGCKNVDHISHIDLAFNSVVSVLFTASMHSVERIQVHSLKPYWNDELDRLKNDSIFWHNLWLSAGKPSSGTLNNIRIRCKSKYKYAIRVAYTSYENKLTDEMCSHYINKNIPEFWKTWNTKFRKNINNTVNINGCTNNEDIANQFADHFSKVFYNSNDDPMAKKDYCSTLGEYKHTNEEKINNCIDNISVELVDKCLHSLKKGKACGPDDLCAEHLLYAHPSLVVYLTALFKSMLLHSYVPEKFGAGICIPLIKDKTGNTNDIDNYRIITLSPVISKLFELVLMSICEDCFVVDPLQFGFKRNTGCPDAIFTLRCTIEHFTQCGGSVYAASLDIRKAFDRVNHYKLFCSLLSYGVPWVIVEVLHNWYSKIFVAVRWHNVLSKSFAVYSGVRQGSCLSPTIFNIFINAFIIQLRLLDVGCHLGTQYIGCLLYADDIILLSPSIAGLQCMLDKCCVVADDLSLEFNTSKSHAVVFGKMHKYELPALYLGSTTVDWCSSIKYLGINLCGGRSLKFDIMPTKRAFYSACNSIFMSGNDADELVLLTLQESYSLPVLMYGILALSLKSRQVGELNVCWKNVFRRVFNYNKWESVKAVILGLVAILTSNTLLCSEKLIFIDICIYLITACCVTFFWTFLLRSGGEMVKTIYVKKSTGFKIDGL